MNEQDEAYMRRALALAEAGLGRVAPNPSVGCVIVSAGAVVGQGRTQDGGRPHAEEVALSQAGSRARGATAYITLEPCAGRSSGAPSCAALLLAATVKRVVYAADDPHAHAAGIGPEMLRKAGVIVDAGLLRAQAEAANAGFFSLVFTGRPIVAIAEHGAGFDAELIAEPGEDALQALARAGRSGLTRVWTPPGSNTARLVASLLRG